MSPPIEPPPGSNRRFGDRRGVRWRIGLGILPSDASVDDLRRITADSRRRYANLRRRLLVDPHLPKDGNDSSDHVMDNPLSQNPDSIWGRFFRNAELERMVDQDLSRLYPEHGSYFQTMGCQSTLRRLLLLWCLKHPDCGYRQGMHELLAPLLYVLHADVEHLSQVRKLYEDHFVDKFDDFPFEDHDLSYNFDYKKFPESREDEINPEGCSSKSSGVNELDPEVHEIVLLSDAYGAEGELGVVISDKYLEHDAHCMFDALMSGGGGAVSMAEFFSPSPSVNSHTGLPPVIEASSALYHLLSIVDSSIHSHLIELGVEPQYFALRWLRVLFGREFSLENLVIIWDEIFSRDNIKINRNADDSGSTFFILSSLRGAFISAFAVSMILYVRSSLLASENAASCLQRLLNFPENVDLKKMLAKTKSLQALALNANNSTLLHDGIYEKAKTAVNRGHSLSLETFSPKTPLSLVPESYWEEKWRDLHKVEKLKQINLEKQVPNRKKGWSEKVKSSLLRTISAPSSSKALKKKNDDTKVSARRSLLDDLSKQLKSDEHTVETEHIEHLSQINSAQEEIMEHQNVDKSVSFLDEDKNLSNSDEERGSNGSMGSEGNSSSFSQSPGHHHHNKSSKSSIDSNSSVVVYNGKCDDIDLSGRPKEESLPISDHPEVCLDADVDKNREVERTKLDSLKNDLIKPESGLQDRKTLPGKFQWLLKLGKNKGGEGISENSGFENTKNCNDVSDQNNNNDPPLSVVVNASSNLSASGKDKSVDQNVMCSLKNLGQTMLDNIQVIESVFQQEQDRAGSMENFSKNVLVGKGQVTAMSALKELRKISILLSEM